MGYDQPWELGVGRGHGGQGETTERHMGAHRPAQDAHEDDLDQRPAEQW